MNVPSFHNQTNRSVMLDRTALNQQLDLGPPLPPSSFSLSPYLLSAFLSFLISHAAEHFVVSPTEHVSTPFPRPPSFAGLVYSSFSHHFLLPCCLSPPLSIAKGVYIMNYVRRRPSFVFSSFPFFLRSFLPFCFHRIFVPSSATVFINSCT
jgi:hypothetical protein